jgi:hypothetical protein
MELSDLQSDGLIGSAPQAAVRKEEKRVKVSRAEQTWQRKLLPLMVGMLVVLTAFFFVASFIQLYYLQTRIEAAPQLDLAPVMVSFEEFEKDLKSRSLNDDTAFGNRLDYSKWKMLSLLEANALQRRYHQAGVLLISRIWTRYLGFVTGTILALVGAAFILGKLRDTTTNLGAESALWKMSITSASPGLILAVLGAALMLATLSTNLEMQVNDGPVYLAQPSASTTSYTAPVPLVPDDQASKPTDSEILEKMKSEGAPNQKK